MLFQNVFKNLSCPSHYKWKTQSFILGQSGELTIAETQWDIIKSLEETGQSLFPYQRDGFHNLLVRVFTAYVSTTALG